MPLVQTFHRFQHHAGHRRKPTEQAEPNTTADNLPHPATQPRSGRHEFGQHREQEAGDHIRHKRAHNERRPADRRQKHIQRMPTADSNKSTDEHHNIHQSVGERIEPRLHTFHRCQGNRRRIHGVSGGRGCTSMRHLNSVDCLRDGMRVLTHSHHVSRRLFLRFHCAPLYWPPADSVVPPIGRATTSWAAVAAFLTHMSLHGAPTYAPWMSDSADSDIQSPAEFSQAQSSRASHSRRIAGRTSRSSSPLNSTTR